MLGEEIDRLRQIKGKMEEARDAGGSELPAWFHQDEKFQTLLASVSLASSPVTARHPFIPDFSSLVGVQERTKKP